eukprot:scaffold122223_cov18-Tisochrysis_lutea.AAC.1
MHLVSNCTCVSCAQVMDTMQTRAKPAAVLTYRSVGSGSGQIDLATSADVSKSDFSCGEEAGAVSVSAAAQMLDFLSITLICSLKRNLRHHMLIEAAMSIISSCA